MVAYRMLDMMLSETSGIRIGDVTSLFNNIAATLTGNPIAFNFLIDRWNDIQNSRCVFSSIRVPILLIIVN